MALVQLRPGERFAGKFQVVRFVGGGGMGAVYEVAMDGGRAHFALKVVESQRRFREAEVLKKLASRHSVEVYEHGVDDTTGMAWLRMELLRGEDLGALVKRRGPLDTSEVLGVFQQVGRGLRDAHQEDVIHCDLKPENIFVHRPEDPGRPTVVKVLDFGIARLLPEGATHDQITSAFGTLEWVAPEQVSEGDVRKQTDVWALGLLAFYLLTGRCYWRSMSSMPPGLQRSGSLILEIVSTTIVPPSARARGLGLPESRLPRGFDEWFLHCVQRDQERRFKSVQEAVRKLEEVLQAEGAVARLPEVEVPIAQVDEPRTPLREEPVTPPVEPVVPPVASPVVPPPTATPPIAPTVPMKPLELPQLPRVAAIPPKLHPEAPRVAPTRSEPRRVSSLPMIVGGGLVAVAVLAVWKLAGSSGGSAGRDAGVPSTTPTPPVATVTPPPATVMQAVADAGRGCPDGMVRVRGGEFAMGDEQAVQASPVHRVRVSPFCLDATEVTVGQFARYWSSGHAPVPGGELRYPGGAFVRVTQAPTEPVAYSSQPGAWQRFCNWQRAGREEHPINCVDWYTMQAYCASRGARLPTEAEWEFAARGTDGRVFPWGPQPPTSALLNACGEECAQANGSTAMSGFGRDRFPETAPVRSFPATRPPGVFEVSDTTAGLFDMGGNVWEWTADGYTVYQSNSGTNIPIDPVVVDETSRVLRGGGWFSYAVVGVRAGSRSDGSSGSAVGNRGARCARGGT